MDEDSSILDYNLDDIPDLHTVEASDYLLTVAHAESTTSSKGDPMLALRFSIDEPNTHLVFHYITLPAKGDDDEQVTAKLRRLKEFYQSFGVDWSGGVDPEALVGETGWAILVEEEYEGEDRNKIRRFTTGK